MSQPYGNSHPTLHVNRYCLFCCYTMVVITPVLGTNKEIFIYNFAMYKRKKNGTRKIGTDILRHFKLRCVTTLSYYVKLRCHI